MVKRAIFLLVCLSGICTIALVFYVDIYGDNAIKVIRPYLSILQTETFQSSSRKGISAKDSDEETHIGMTTTTYGSNSEKSLPQGKGGDGKIPGGQETSITTVEPTSDKELPEHRTSEEKLPLGQTATAEPIAGRGLPQRKTSEGKTPFGSNAGITTIEPISANSEKELSPGKQSDGNSPDVTTVSIPATEATSQNDLKGQDLKLRKGNDVDISVGTQTSKCISENVFTSRQQGTYLLPIEYYNSGPNYLYRNFKVAAIMAIYQNRAIVEISFPRHFAQGKGLEQDMRPLNSTFDVQQLNKVLQTTSLKDFKNKCNNSVDGVLLPTTTMGLDQQELMENYESHRYIYQKLYGITLPKGNAVDSRNMLYDFGVDSPSAHTKCLGMFHMLGFKRVVNTNMDAISAKVDRNLVRPKFIRDVAQHLMARMCDEKPYLAIHWRNKSGEGCRIPWKCHDMSIVTLANENAFNVISDIRVLQKQYNINCIYVAYPPYAALFMETLRKNKVPRIFDDEYLFRDEDPEMDLFQRDDYMLSLLEQEICFQADLFLGWRLSSWTTIIERGRDSLEPKPISILLQSLPSWKNEL